MFTKFFKKIFSHQFIGYTIVVLFIIAFLAVRYTVGSIVSVSGLSMYPTFNDGDYVYGTIVYDNTELNVGDIVILKDDGRLLIKRIHGTPGQTIENKEISPPIEQTTLGENEYYVVGDNYGNSYDSRMIGPVSRDLIVFKYAGVHWNLITLCLTFLIPLVLFTVVLTIIFVPGTRKEISRISLGKNDAELDIVSAE